MKRSKSFKKAVSVILVMLMMFTVMSSGVSAFAAAERIYTIEDTYYTASPDEVVAETELMPLDEYLVEQFSTCPGSVFVNEYKIPAGQINELASLIYDNCPELFHIASLQYYPVNGYIYTLIPTYSCTPEEYAVMLDECEKSADKLLEGIKGNDSLGEVEKALLLHDRIAVLCEYDYENYLNGAIPRESYNMYGTLVNQFAVCQGYAETYLYLLRQVGIDGYICESDALNHAWNIVEVDGEEYHVDITWDDKTWDVTGKVYHDNFLRSSEGIYATGHEASDYITTPVATTYDDYFWQDSQAAFQLLDDEIYYIDYSDAYIRRYSDNSDVKNVSDTWMASASSYYRGCHARLDTDGERLLYTSSKAVFALDAETGDTEEIWRPEGETEYHRIYGFKYEDNYLICDLNKTPNFAADTKTLYQQKKLYPEVEIVDSGVCGDNLTWTLDVAGTLTISGTGDMYDFEMVNSPWFFNTAIKSVVICEGAASIGDNAFSGCSALASVELPYGVTDIGECAFWYCEALADIELPESVTAIGEDAFAYCTDLESITIPASVTYIGKSPFYSAESLTSITVDEDNTAYCSDADGVLFNKDKTVLVCYPCGKTEEEYTIPATVTAVADYAFSYSMALKSIIMSEAMTTIGEGAFELCHGLTDVEIPGGVTYLGMYSFGACSKLKTVHIPVSVTVIDGYAFDSCKKLTDVYYGGSEAQWNEIAIGTSNNPLINATIHFTCKHSYSAVVTEPTCTAQGYTTYTCICGDSYIADYTDKLQHSYKGVITTPATHTEEGVMTYICDICGDSYTEAIAKTAAHSHSGVVTTPATHTTEGVMTYTCACGDSYTEAIAKTAEHSFSGAVTVPATHTAEGVMTYTCGCGNTYTEAIAKTTAHSHTGVITVPATHTTEGVMTYTCICGDTYTEVIARTPAHSYSAVVTAPTCIEQGFTTYTCVCGSIYMDNFTDSVPHGDADGDAFCDYCGEDLTVDPSENCSCMCHKDGFMGFIWKIVKFFWSLFGMNPVCECGKAHY